MDELIAELQQLITRFSADEIRLCAGNSTYTETDARVEYIDPLFSALGWDMNNARSLPNSLKDVQREQSQLVESASKRPDYTFRIAAIKKFFVEAKKPSVNIQTNREAAYQIRSYGWSAGFPVSVLTNFRTFRVYDTTIAPNENDDPNVCLLWEIDYTNYINVLDELLAGFGRESVGNGQFDKMFSSLGSGRIQVTELFLEKINTWRLALANDLYTRHNELSTNDVNDLTQKIINRIIFTRMCEDRGIEGEQRLRNVAGLRSYVDIQRFFREMDQRYNTGLFDITIDPLHTHYTINSQLFLNIVEEVYYPNSPYSFSVLSADFLGQVYEHFLIKRLSLNDNGIYILEDKPAYVDREIVTTPQPLVDETVRKVFTGKISEMRSSGTLTLGNLLELRVLDLAVGSGRFLIRAFDLLIDAAIEYLTLNDRTRIYKRAAGDYRLSFDVKVQLLQACLYGIDIDYNAVEICRFSLLVKLLEDEYEGTLPDGDRILPDLDNNIIWGNSVVDSDFAGTPATIELVSPLDWSQTNLPTTFDIIVGNPPYLKTGEMRSKSKEEYKYYQDNYDTSFRQFDKYFIFIERAVKKISANGWIGMIVPNKWITNESARKLREKLARQSLIHDITDFGNELLFEDKSIYVCVLILSRVQQPNFEYTFVYNNSAWQSTAKEPGISLPTQTLINFDGAAWVLPSNNLESRILNALYANSISLGDNVADVVNGIQTSAEDVFPIDTWQDNGQTITFQKDGRQWTIEKAITRPYLMDSSQVVSYKPVLADALIIFPYEYNQKGEAVLLSPALLAQRFPLAHQYLNHYQIRLTNRNVNPVRPANEFYAYGRHQSLVTAFLPNKIVYSVNQIGGKYGIDTTGVGFASGGTAGEVAITNLRGGYSIEFILAILNTNVGEYFLRRRGSAFRGGYYSRGTAVMSDFPVPRIDFNNMQQAHTHHNITVGVQRLMGLSLKLQGALGRNRDSLNRQYQSEKRAIEMLCYELWGINQLNIGTLVLPGA